MKYIVKAQLSNKQTKQKERLETLAYLGDLSSSILGILLRAYWLIHLVISNWLGNEDNLSFERKIMIYRVDSHMRNSCELVYEERVPRKMPTWQAQGIKRRLQILANRELLDESFINALKEGRRKIFDR